MYINDLEYYDVKILIYFTTLKYSQYNIIILFLIFIINTCQFELILEI